MSWGDMSMGECPDRFHSIYLFHLAYAAVAIHYQYTSDHERHYCGGEFWADSGIILHSMAMKLEKVEALSFTRRLQRLAV